jgi:hypothetical protein
MVTNLPVEMPIGPASTRVFVGYKLPQLSREEFFDELGKTFMPGTPYMQAPLGLNAYVPAVLDPTAGEGLPDELALIVYSSLEQYLHARKTSLRRRVYTHAHVAVFDMAAEGGGGQFPGSVASPDLKGARHCWTVFDTPTDWQAGTTQLLVATPTDAGTGSPEELREYTAKNAGAVRSSGVQQIVCVATPGFAALWVYSRQPVDAPSRSLFSPSYATLARHLEASPVPMPTLTEGVEISGASMFTFRFVRELRFHL